MRAHGLQFVGALALGLLVAACGAPEPSFPATSSCPEQPRAAGTIPDLERLVPADLDGRAADTVDSGWNCLPSTLGSYATHGVTRLEFGGATWDDGNGNGSVAAIFRSVSGDPALQAGWVEEFYEDGARASTKTENIEITHPSLPGAGAVYRLETLNDLSLQTIVIWPGDAGVHVVLVATTVDPGASRDAHNARVSQVVEAAAGAAGEAGSSPAASVVPSPA